MDDLETIFKMRDTLLRLIDVHVESEDYEAEGLANDMLVAALWIVDGVLDRIGGKVESEQRVLKGLISDFTTITGIAQSL